MKTMMFLTIALLTVGTAVASPTLYMCSDGMHSASEIKIISHKGNYITAKFGKDVIYCVNQKKAGK